MSEFTKNGVTLDFDTLTNNNHHIIKVLGLQKDKAIIDKLGAILKPYVLDSIKTATELPTEACSCRCQDSLKGPFKINAAIKAL